MRFTLRRSSEQSASPAAKATPRIGSRRVAKAAAAAVERLEDRRMLSATTYHGSLDGKIVYLNSGHGFAWDGSVWRTGRGEGNEMVEDFGTQDQNRSYADYLLRAGATVVPLRPIGHQLNEVVLDNTSPSVTYTGAWANTTQTTGYYGVAGAVGYRYANIAATQTAVATYTPTIAAAGFYPVYTWVKDGTDRATDSLYRINYSGGSAEVTVNHKVVGEGWIYLGTYYFENGTGGSVQVSNKSSNASGVVIADAIRFGNGMGSVTRGGKVSGLSREDEAALYWLEAANGVGTSFSQFRGGLTADGDANVTATPRYSAFMNGAAFGQALFLSFHSNAAGGTARGTLGLYNSASGKTTNQQRLAFLLAKELNTDLVATGSPPMEYAWSSRSDASLTYINADFDYGEIRSGANGNEFDGTILEVAFHDNAQDAALMRDPTTRDRIGRAAYQGTVKYFNEFGGASAAVAPAAPTAVRAAVAVNGDLSLNWAAPAVSGILGDAAAKYVVYVSRNGYGFDVLGTTTGAAATTFTVPAAQLDGGVYYFKVAAANAGGESPASPVVGGRKPPTAGGTNRVLVVNAFDRLDRTQDARQSIALVTGGTVATVDRVWARVGNSYDYVVQAGTAIAAYAGGVGFDSAGSADVAAGRVDLTRYQTVIWLAGEANATDETFSAAEQTAVAAYVAQGGRLFTSGSEVGYDLGRASGPTAADRAFLAGPLRAGFVADDAGTYAVAASAGSIFAGLPALAFDNAAGATYDVDSPDVLSAAGGSTVAMAYSGGTGGAAAVQYADAATKSRVVTFGFPFESISSAANRAAVLARVFDYFETAVSAAPAAPLLAAAADSGSSSSDKVTNFNNAAAAKALQFAVSGTVAGATVRVYADGILIGSATATGTSTLVVTNGSAALADGSRQFTATQQEPNRSESVPSAALAVLIDTAAPQAPAAPDLTAASDAGASNTDDLTNVATPTFTGTTPAGEAVTLALLANGSTVASGTFAGGATWSLTPSAPLAAGVYSVAVTATDVAGNASVASPSLTVTIDTAAPVVTGITVNDGQAQRSMVRSAGVTFDRAVTLASGPAFTLVRREDGLGVPVAAANPSGDGRTWTLAFGGPSVSAASLADGVYDLTVRAAGVSSLAGQPMAADAAPVAFHRLYGDYNGDKGVGGSDYFQFVKAYGKDEPDAALLSIFDVDASGLVGGSDYFQFVKRYGKDPLEY